MITPEELEHVDWLITVNERRKVASYDAGNYVFSDVYARAEDEARELKELLVNPVSPEVEEILDKIFGVDKIRKLDTL